MEKYTISVNANIVALVLGTGALLLMLASVTGQLAIYEFGAEDSRLIRLFHLGDEKNVPTAFSTLLLLIAAMLLLLVSILAKQEGLSILYWLVLASGFILMAVDEAWAIHEKLIKPMRRLMGNDHLGFFYYAWLVPAIVLILVLALFFLKFLVNLPKKTRNVFLIAAVLYLSGAIGAELVGGHWAELYGNHNLVYSFLVTIEECLEMTGAIVFIWALLNYIGERFQVVHFKVRNSR